MTEQEKGSRIGPLAEKLVHEACDYATDLGDPVGSMEVAVAALCVAYVSLSVANDFSEELIHQGIDKVWSEVQRVKKSLPPLTNPSMRN